MTTCIYANIFRNCLVTFPTRRDKGIVVCPNCNEKMRGHIYQNNRAKALKEQPECSITACHINADLDCHHILPISHGGGNELENLRILCKRHHRLEHDKLRKQGK